MRYHARWVLPVDGAAVRDGTVVVDRECITWVGPRRMAPPGPDTELGDAIIAPGLVNTHIHLDLAPFRDAIATRAFFPWVRSLARALDDLMDDEARRDAAEWSVADQLAHGVTSMADTSQTRAAFDALRGLGARGIAYLETFGPDPSRCAASLTRLRAAVVAARRDETARVRLGVSPHAPYSVSDALYAAMAEYAAAEALPVAVHIAESPDESRLVATGDGEFAAMLRGRGIPVAPRARSPVALLHGTGVLRTRPLCIHAVQVDADDVAMLRDAGVAVAHCPRANRWFDHGDAPVDALRARGIVVGLGTDSAAANDDVHLLAEATAAVSHADAAGRLELATLAGARALGIDADVGSLRPGKRADLAAFGVHDAETCDRDPAAYLLAACGAAPSLLTLVDGVVRARDGRVTPEDDARDQRVAALAARVRAWMAHGGDVAGS